MRFRDRTDAGRRLAERLGEYAGRSDVLVLGLPRGGVPVAAEIAERLDAPLDVWVVRKLGVPGYPELAMGAIAAGGTQVLSRELIESLHISDAQIEQVSIRERAELERRIRVFGGGRYVSDIRGRIVILVDDGLATGATLEAAILAVRQLEPSAIVAAVPVGARESCARIAALADRLVCVETPALFRAVGQWYEDFSETSDDEVRRLLDAARERSAGSAATR